MDAFRDYMQRIDYVALTIFSGPIFAIVCGILWIIKSKNDHMANNSMKSSPSSSFNKPHNRKKDNLALGLNSDSQRRNSKNTIKNQRKSGSGNKLKVSASNDTILHTKSNHDHDSLPGFTIKSRLKSEVCCYERCESSYFKDNVKSCHIMQHRNKTSTEGEECVGLNSCSSNEDLSSTYLEKTNQSKPETRTRKKRQQKRKIYPKSINNTGINVQATAVDEESKNIVKSCVAKRKSSNTVISLRKQCTKAAAFKAAMNSSKMSLTRGHSNLEFNFNVRSSLSSASSTSSINSSISSSASTSPTHSANSSPTSSPKASKRNTEHVKKKMLASPLKQFTKLNMNEQELVKQIKRYVIDPNLLKIYGFPVESIHHKGCVEIYKCLPKHLAEEAVTKDNQRHHRHFYGPKKCAIINEGDGLYASSCDFPKWNARFPADSGHGSGESSPRCTDSDSSEMSEEDSISPLAAFYTPDGVYQIFSDYCNSVEKQCVRCSRLFHVNEKGEYLSFESCSYHWGKLRNVYDGKCSINTYSCCQGEEFSEGCSKHPLHVWNGVVVGVNGPYTGFLHTQHKKINHHKCPKIYAIDCEMSYTGLGLEVTKVTVVRFDGSLAYEHFVKTQAQIIDYNTRFSGVSEKDFLPNTNKAIKTFAEVQRDLLNLFDADTILIGHGLDNDLKVLRLVHKTIVDTSLIFSHSTGYPYRRSLKNLTNSFLRRDIQCGSMGHSSFEDSRACLELVMWQIRKDLRHWNHQ